MTVQPSNRLAAAGALCGALLAMFPALIRGEVASPDESRWRVNVGAVAGTLLLDEALDNYRWDVRPTLQTGMQAMVTRDRFAIGVRLWRASTTQDSGIPGEATAPTVNLTGTELAGSWRVSRYRGMTLWGLASAGNLHLGWSPDEMSFDPGGGLSPIQVRYAPVDEWMLGIGAAVGGSVYRGLGISLQAEMSTLALDTAYRSGSEIVETRERFQNWSLQLQVSWLLHYGT